VFQPASRILLLTDSLVSDGRNPLALEKAVGAALSFGKVDLSLALLQAMKHRGHTLRQHYFWPLFIAASKSDGEKGSQYVQIFFLISFNNPHHILPILKNFILDFNVSCRFFQTISRNIWFHHICLSMGNSPLTVLAISVNLNIVF
jgi:hypothetical protein